jgi:DNA modification methylase
MTTERNQNASLRIDPEFDSYLPRLSGQEIEELRASLKAEGCREALLVWNGILVDGHNRYRLCTELGIPFVTQVRDFKDRDQALNWILCNQLARRNLTSESYSYLRGKRYELEKKQGERTDLVTSGKSCQKSTETKPTLTTATKLAEQHKVSERTIRNDAQFAKAVDQLGPELRKKVLDRDSGLRKNDVVKLSKLPEPARERVMQAVETKQARNVTAAVQDHNRTQARAELSAKVAPPSNVTPLYTQRVICGDAVEQLKLLPTASAHLCLTDPPYGLDTHRTRDGGKDYADGKDYALELLDQVCAELARVLTPDAHLYVFNGYSYLLEFKQILIKRFGRDAVQDNPIVWIKDNHTMCNFSQWYASKCEYVWFVRRSASRPLAAKCSTDVIDCARERNHHSAAKPTELLRRFIENSTVPGETVIDPFAGSGSTLKAAKQTNRNAIGVEVDPVLAAAAQGAAA